MTKTKSLILVASALFALISFLFSQLPSKFVQTQFFKTAFHNICNKVDQEFYENSEYLKKWTEDCHREASGLSENLSLPHILSLIQRQLSKMNVSHLEIWDPITNHYFFEGVAKDTGLRLKNIDGHPLVHEVLKSSSAETAGFQRGDEILEFEGEEVSQVLEGEGVEGQYRVLRGAEQIELFLVSKEYAMNIEPEIEWLPKKVALLKIPRFIPEDGKSSHQRWEAIASELQAARGIVVDLRGNPGGDFQGMLRALSPFFCDPTDVGVLIRPRNQNGGDVEVDEYQSAGEFADDLRKVSNMILRTFSDYSCLAHPVRVLVDSGTSSVAEIFAHSFFRRPHSAVWGERTAGNVLSAFIFSVELGAAYTLHIPYNEFVAADGKRLEGIGVVPQKELKYRLADELAQKDSWYVQAAGDLVN